MRTRKSSRNTRLPATRSLIAFTAMLIASPLTQAAAVSWTTDVSGLWSNASLWSSNPALPAAADDVSITTVTGLKTINHDSGSTTIRSLTTNDSALVLIDGISSLAISLGGSNAGILRTGGSSAGTLNLNGGTLTNTNGELHADTDGTISLNGVTVVGGELNANGSGVIRAAFSNNNYLDGVTINGALDMATNANSRERVINGMTLNGTIDLNNNGLLSFEHDNDLDGSGSVVFGNTGPGNRFDLSGGGTTTIGADITLRGENGTIGLQNLVSGTQTLLNNGLVSADVNGGTITITESAVTNNNVLEARNGGTLNLESNVTNTASGVIRADNGLVLQSGLRITDGTISTANGGIFRVTSSNSNFLESVTIDGLFDMATVVNSRERVTTGITLNNVIDLNNNAILSFEGDNLLDGTGTVIFGNTGAGNRFDLSGSGTTTIGADITLRGENGTIGRQNLVSGTQTLVNDGLVSADVSGGTITIVDSAVTNNNVLEARNGATLILESNVTNTSTGVINADNGVVRQSGQRITGGAITSSNGGVLRAIAHAGNYLDGTSIAGTLDMATIANSRERVVNDLTLDGTININESGIISFEGDNTIDGNGDVVFGASSVNNRFDLDGAGTTTLGSGITIRGENGTIGNQLHISGTQTLANNGLVSADVAGGTIIITQSDVINNNVLEARNGGILSLFSNVDNAAGEILAEDSVVRLNAMRVTGGEMNSSGTGSFLVISSAANYLDGVTLNGALDMATLGNSRERVVNGLTLNGVIDINNNGILSFEGDGELDGNGTVVFGDTSASNRFVLDGDGTTTLGSGITLRGEKGTIGGQLNISGAQTLINNGLISADVTDGLLTITDSAVTNNAVLEARNGAALELESDVNNSSTGIVRADNGVVLQAAQRVSGGTISTTNGGVFRANNSAGNYLDATTLAGTLDLATNTGSRERVVNGLTLDDGTINLNNNSILSFEGTSELGGNGTVIFGDTSSSNRFVLDGNGATTIGSGVTLRGQNGTIGGQLNISGTQTLINNGLISADVAGGLLTILDSSVTNNAVLEARNGATLELESNVNNSAAGEIHADNGTVLQNAQQVTGGTISTTNGGVFRVNNSAGNYLDATTLAGILDMATNAGSRERVVNGLTLDDGTINLNSNGVLSFEGVSGLDGTGTVVFGDTGSNNRFVLDGNGSTTIGSGVTLRGQNGTIGGQLNASGTQTLINNGTINSDTGGLLTLTDSAVTNNGTLRAQNGALTSQVQVTGTGSLQVDSTGVMTLANLANTQGKLAMGATGAVLNIGTQNLTINSDYTNVGAGSGNSFNRRAGVSGAGQIVAGGDVAQAITGSGVTNGATTNATMTIGNMRVGANTFNYQVANTGTTGPSLRGAIQTNVNGGNITDARLSGDGVTASNYDTGGPGSDTGDLGVVFTAASAGVLAPLVDQKLNFRSNFENIVDQQLDIILAADAAAYNAAVGSAGTPVEVANQRIGGTNTAAVTVSNTADAGSFSEDLNATIGGASGAASGSGSVNGLLAGANNNSGISVAVDTSSAGAKSGAVTLDYETTGTVNGVSNGLGTASVGSQEVAVSGNVYQVAQADGAIPATVNLGNFRAGSGAQAAPGINITNTDIAPAGFQEGLDAIVGAITGQATGSGFTNAVAGDSGTVNVGLSSINAGLNTGTVDVQLKSNGTTTGGSNGLGELDLGSAQTITVNGTGYNAAAGDAGSPVQVANQRVGGTNSAAVMVTNTADAGSFSEDLNAAVSGNSGAASGSGNVAGLLAGASDNSGISVAVDTSSAGAKSGTVTLGYETTGAVNGVSNGLGASDVGSQDVTVNGNVYQVAQADGTIPTTINLGNFRAGSGAQAAPGINITNTDIAPAGFQEGLDAVVGSITGQATGSGFTNAVAGDNGTVNVGLSSINAGLNSGTVDFQLKSNGITTGGSNGLGELDLGSAQTITINGTGWRLAEANTQPGTINFGNVLVGSVQAQFLDIQNIAVADGFSERLDAMFKAGGTTGDATNNGGSVDLLAAGSSNNTAMSIGIDTSTIGGKSGQVLVAYNSNGSGTSGLGITGLPDQSIGVLATVEGTVGTLAQPGPVTPNPVDFGKVRINSAPVGPVDLSISNLAVIGEGLNASISTLDSDFAATGSFDSLAAGATDNSSLQVRFTGTDTAGAHTGDATVALVSDGSFNGGVTTNLPSQTVDMSAEVYRLANPLLNTTSVDVVARVGDAVSADQAVSITNSSPDIYTEGLKVSVAGASGNAQSNGGSIANLIAQGTDTTSILVGLASTATAGVTSDSVNLDFVSTGAGTTEAADVAAQTASGTVTVNGKVYAPAIGQLNTATVDFGIVRVGDTVAARNINVENTAATVALNDTLRANLSGVGGAFTADSTVGGIASGASGNLGVGLNTASAGIYNQTGTVSFLSQNPDMADVSAGSDGSIQVSAQVNNLANADYDLLSAFGTLSQTGDSYVLDFGNLTLGGSTSALLQLDNDIFGPADFLRGEFDLTAVNDFLLSGWNPFSDLGAGDAFGGLNIDFTSTGLGLFEDTIYFNGFSYNDSDPDGIAQARSLQIRINVVDGTSVPVPGTVFLILLGLLTMGQLRGLRVRR